MPCRVRSAGIFFFYIHQGFSSWTAYYCDMKKTLSLLMLVALIFVQFPFAPTAQAAVSIWQKSFSVIPQGSDDFSSSAFQQSLRNMKADGANYVNLIIPYYQSNLYSTDIGRGWNTPSDASLVSAVQYAHSIGLHVSIGLYLEDYSNDWRANINPGDRDGWYRNYGNVLTYYGRIAQQQHVEQFVIGAELISMASASVNGDNTQRWNTMIAQVRAVYGGKLVYSANRGNQDGFGNEVQNIGFWDKLDIIGISGYYSLWGDGSVASLKSAWSAPNNNDVAVAANRWNKPVIFTEIGYKSVSGAHNNPWDSGMGGSYDPQEQVNDYTALFEYWNDYSYMQGVDLWWWKSNPNAGGSGDIDYTPQNKPVEQVLKQWWLGGGGTTSGNVTFTALGSANPTSAAAGQPVTLVASVAETAGSSSGDNVDLEVYQGGTRVFQKFYSGQNFTQGQTQNYSVAFTPNTTGTYVLKIGVFNSDWSKAYAWNDNAATIPVGSGGVTTAGPLDIWWPSDGSHIQGVQPFKAMVENIDVGSYNMYWSVDGGGRVLMGNSNQDYPHKEALVDVSGWHWQGTNPYTITFTATNSSGSTISQKSIKILTP